MILCYSYGCLCPKQPCNRFSSQSSQSTSSRTPHIPLSWLWLHLNPFHPCNIIVSNSKTTFIHCKCMYYVYNAYIALQVDHFRNWDNILCIYRTQDISHLFWYGMCLFIVFASDIRSPLLFHYDALISTAIVSTIITRSVRCYRDYIWG